MSSLIAVMAVPLTCSGATGFLTSARTSVAGDLSVQLLSESIQRQNDERKESEIVANVGGKKYQRYKKQYFYYLYFLFPLMIYCQNVSAI